MFFFPYQLDIDLKGIPIITYLVCIVCAAMFVHQEYSYKSYTSAINEFCSAEAEGLFGKFRSLGEADSCQELFTRVRHSRHPSEELSTIANELQSLDSDNRFNANLNEISSSLNEEYTKFDKAVPVDVTTQWWFEPQELNLQRMITSSFSHADWEHLVFNLVFFFAFAVSAELLLGSPIFLAVVLLNCVTTSFIYSYGAFGFNNSLPTLGLSAVVTTIMAMMAVIFPHKHVRIFYWIIVMAGVFRIPIFVLVAFYVGTDIYGLAKIVEGSNIDYLSHIGGAATGAVLAMVYLVFNWRKVNTL